jgi:hypothetical protein
VIAMKDINPLLAVALAASLALAGCVGTQGDASELSASSAGDTELTIAVEAENPGDVSHMGLELDRALAHDANVSLPDGFHEVSLAGDHADVVHDGEADRVEIASGTVPVGTYDQVLLRLANATVETAASEDGHDHGDGENGHDHGDESKAKPVSSGSLDLPLNTTFETTLDEPTEIVFTIDVAESHDGDSLTPVFAGAEVVRCNETVSNESDLETRANPDADVPQDDPAARVAVFAPNGDKVYEPAFDPKDDEFVNSVSDGFPAGERVQFSATESGAVAEGAVIEEYAWQIGDGTTASGQTAAHVYEEAGVYEVTLETTDTYGNTDTHTVRIVVVGWAQTVADTSFEDGSEWSQQASEVEVNEWQLAGPGYESSQAWHVGLSDDAEVDANGSGAGYGPTNEAVRLVSPQYEIPEDFKLVGYELFVDGHTSSGQLELSLVTEEDTKTLGVVNDEAEWKRMGGMDALEGVAGQTVQFELAFTAELDPLAEGPGYAVDAFTLAGMAEDDLNNSELLEDASGGHGGHDHEH